MTKEYIMCTRNNDGELVPLEVRPVHELELENQKLRDYIKQRKWEFESIELPDLIAKVERMTIERCAGQRGSMTMSGWMHHGRLLRALQPNIKLEGL